MESIVIVENVSKNFNITKRRTNVVGHLRNKFFRQDNTSKDNVFRLENINFTLQKNDNIGIVGLNGSGKSTLLKIIAGLMRPKTGNISVNGSIILLSGFGHGMDSDLTVEENIYLYGSIYGLSRSVLRDEIENILKWAELEDYAQARLRILSAGMKTRLAFSTTTYINKDIVLLDEALTAGDRKFKDKCFEYFENTIKSGKHYLICTHDIAFVGKFCNKTLWLNKGQQIQFGPTEEVLRNYINFINTGEISL